MIQNTIVLSNIKQQLKQSLMKNNQNTTPNILNTTKDCKTSKNNLIFHIKKEKKMDILIREVFDEYKIRLPQKNDKQFLKEEKAVNDIQLYNQDLKEELDGFHLTYDISSINDQNNEIDINEDSNSDNNFLSNFDEAGEGWSFVSLK